MKNTISHDTREIFVNGKTVRISFSDKDIPGAIEEVKRILTESFIKSQVCKD